MSVSVDTGGKSGKKPLNTELNLVPYIDLLTCMVSFLLITAVWTQLARLEAQQKGQGQVGTDEPPTEQVKITVVVNEEGYNLIVNQDQMPIAKQGEQYNFEALGTELKKLKEAHPDKNDVQVASEDPIKFDVLIKTMDTALTARFADISLIDAGGAGI
jgi:biopolymer transport protein ExbD